MKMLKLIKRKVYRCCYCGRGRIGNIRRLKQDYPTICPRCKHRFTEGYKPQIIGEVGFGLSYDEKKTALERLIEGYDEEEVKENG